MIDSRPLSCRNYTADGQLLSVAADDGSATAFVRQHGPYSLVAWHQLQVRHMSLPFNNVCLTLSSKRVCTAWLALHTCQGPGPPFVKPPCCRLTAMPTLPAAQAALADALPPDVLLQEAALARYEVAAGGMTLHFHGSQQPPVTAQLLIGSDGAQSGVREQLLGDGPPMYLGRHAAGAAAPFVLVAWWHGDV